MSIVSKRRHFISDSFLRPVGIVWHITCKGLVYTCHIFMRLLLFVIEIRVLNIMGISVAMDTSTEYHLLAGYQVRFNFILPYTHLGGLKVCDCNHKTTTWINTKLPMNKNSSILIPFFFKLLESLECISTLECVSNHLQPITLWANNPWCMDFAFIFDNS